MCCTTLRLSVELPAASSASLAHGLLNTCRHADQKRATHGRKHHSNASSSFTVFLELTTKIKLDRPDGLSQRLTPDCSSATRVLAEAPPKQKRKRKCSFTFRILPASGSSEPPEPGRCPHPRSTRWAEGRPSRSPVPAARGSHEDACGALAPRADRL